MSTTEIAAALLTTKQAAHLVGCGERTLWRWSRSGIAPAPVRIGRGTRAATRYPREALEEWIRNGCPRVDGTGGEGER